MPLNMRRVWMALFAVALVFGLLSPAVANAKESEFEFYYQRIESVEQINNPEPEGWWEKTKSFVKGVGNLVAKGVEQVTRTYLPGEGEKTWYSKKDKNIAYKVKRTKVRDEAHLLELMGVKDGDLSKLTNGQKALLAVYKESQSQAVKDRSSVSYRSKISVTLSDTTGFDDTSKYPCVKDDFWPNSTGRMIQLSSNFFNYSGSEENAKMTFIHEFSHSCDRTVKEIIKPYGKDGHHSCNELTHSRSAFVEGWAEFNEMLESADERKYIQNAINTVRVEKAKGEYASVDPTDASLSGKDLMSVEGIVANIFYRMSSELPDGRDKVFASFKNTNIYWRSTRMMLKNFASKNPGDANALAAILNEETHGKLSDADLIYYLGNVEGVKNFIADRNAAATSVVIPVETTSESSSTDSGVIVKPSANGSASPFTAGSK